MSCSTLTSANSDSASTMAGSRRRSSTVTETLTSEVVTTSTGVRWRSKTSNKRRRKPWAISIRVEVMSTTVTCFFEASAVSGRSLGRTLGGDERAGPVGALRVQDADRDVARDGRLNRRRVQHLGAEVGQLGRLGERQVRHDLRRRDEPGIGGEHAVHVGPDLDFARAEAGADDRRRVVRPAAAERGRDARGRGADESAQHRDAAGGQRADRPASSAPRWSRGRRAPPPDGRRWSRPPAARRPTRPRARARPAPRPPCGCSRSRRRRQWCRASAATPRAARSGHRQYAPVRRTRGRCRPARPRGARDPPRPRPRSCAGPAVPQGVPGALGIPRRRLRRPPRAADR